MHVLIIEDEPLIAMSIEDALRDSGCTSFAFATSATDAVAAATLRCPDLITADVQLAPGCGIEAVGAICGGKPIPVIFITGTAARVRERITEHAVLNKPFSEQTLQYAVAASMLQ